MQAHRYTAAEWIYGYNSASLVPLAFSVCKVYNLYIHRCLQVCVSACVCALYYFEKSELIWVDLGRCRLSPFPNTASVRHGLQ